MPAYRCQNQGVDLSKVLATTFDVLRVLFVCLFLHLGCGRSRMFLAWLLGCVYLASCVLRVSLWHSSTDWSNQVGLIGQTP